ncbi:hypothetical protein AYO49_03065 [Verrucomicrobiaceae bacterium SCGC AG-212-N21]|nr:hypothetical protein AYO49_03065 [Verrucomicrobiaceae bacterium SCGC AG-212-N21]
MIRYSKPLGQLLDFKQEFFDANDAKLESFERIAGVYQKQPRRASCKNCAAAHVPSPDATFVKLDTDYWFCGTCGHCNGAHEDTVEFCLSMYTDDDGKAYSKTYVEAGRKNFEHRTKEIYVPKAKFLKESLEERGAYPATIADFGAGAGYFISAAKQCGFDQITGYEPSKTLAEFGNAMLGGDVIRHHDLADTTSLIQNAKATVASFVGVLEHLQDLRGAYQALRDNEHIRYVLFSVPMFCPSVVLETVFPEIMPRHLAAGHTHLYTEQSIQHICDEFGFKRVSEWWFGLDMTDLFRSVLVSLGKSSAPTAPLRSYWQQKFGPLLDSLQGKIDEARMSSEVHMLIEKVN